MINGRRAAHAARRAQRAANRAYCRRLNRKEARDYAKAVHRSAAWWRHYDNPRVAARRRRHARLVARDVRKYDRQEKRRVLAAGKTWINYPACPSMVTTKIHHTLAAQKRKEERKAKRIACRRAVAGVSASTGSKAAKSKKASKAAKSKKTRKTTC
jgi:hypothetical protein